MYKVDPGIQFKPFEDGLKDQSYLAIMEDGRYLQISNLTYRLCLALNGEKTLLQAKEIVEEQVKRKIELEVIDYAVTKVLGPNNFFCDINGEKQNITRFVKKSPLLLFELKILKSEWLLRINELTKVFFYKNIFYSACSIIGLSHLWFYSFFNVELTQFNELTMDQAFIIGTIYFLTVIFHEIGHASASYFYGAKHKGIGIGIYIRSVVLFADVTDTWRLPQKQRAIVAAAGIYFQMISSSILLLLYYLLIPSPLLLFVIYLIDISAILYLQPFLKFDGYWIFSDLLGIPNLHTKVAGIYSFIINKYILLRSAKNTFLSKLTPNKQKMMVAYMISSLVFFIYFVFRLGLYVVNTIMGYPELLDSTLSMVTSSYKDNNYLQIVNSTFGFLLANFSLLVLALFASKKLKSVFEFLRRNGKGSQD